MRRYNAEAIKKNTEQSFPELNSGVYITGRKLQKHSDRVKPVVHYCPGSFLSSPSPFNTSMFISPSYIKLKLANMSRNSTTKVGFTLKVY